MYIFLQEFCKRYYIRHRIDSNDDYFCETHPYINKQIGYLHKVMLCNKEKHLLSLYVKTLLQKTELQTSLTFVRFYLKCCKRLMSGGNMTLTFLLKCCIVAFLASAALIYNKNRNIAVLHFLSDNAQCTLQQMRLC